MAQRLTVTKTCKLYIGGALARSESGRTVRVTDHQGEFMANAALASRKDGRDAVVAARKGQAAWASATPYNRGQVMYRMAEMMEGRRAELVQALRDLSGLSAAPTKLQQAQATLDGYHVAFGISAGVLVLVAGSSSPPAAAGASRGPTGAATSSGSSSSEPARRARLRSSTP